MQMLKKYIHTNNKNARLYVNINLATRQRINTKANLTSNTYATDSNIKHALLRPSVIGLPIQGDIKTPMDYNLYTADIRLGLQMGIERDRCTVT